MLCVWWGICVIISLVVIGLVYKAYTDGCRHEYTSLPWLRPYPVRGHRLLWGYLCAHDLLNICCFLPEQQQYIVALRHRARFSQRSKVVSATTAKPPLCQLLSVTQLMFELAWRCLKLTAVQDGPQ